MKRKSYQSTLRSESKQRTQERIVTAALSMQGKGVTDFSVIALEAGVSAATIRKYFPTQEEMYRGCTAHFMRTYAFPSLEALGMIRDLSQRVVETVTVICELHEASFGQTWLAYKLQDESAAMAEARRQGDVFVEAAIGIILKDNESSGGSERTGFLKGMLSPLAYRSFRLHGELPHEACVKQICGTVLRHLGLQAKRLEE